MSADRWHTDAPLPESYSRVTDADRFRPLHALAVELLERLAESYDATRTADFEPLAGQPPFEHARPPITLTPAAATAAPISVAFTRFPGLVVRCGRWLAESFPGCGCDACAETADEEGERLREMLRDVVAGRFRESLSLPLFGPPRLEWTLGDPSAVALRGGGRVLGDAEARVLRRDGAGEMRWQPWPTRPSERTLRASVDDDPYRRSG